MVFSPFVSLFQHLKDAAPLECAHDKSNRSPNASDEELVHARVVSGGESGLEHRLAFEPSDEIRWSSAVMQGAPRAKATATPRGSENAFEQVAMCPIVQIR